MSDKYLIINADDFGMCHSQNVAIMDLLQSGAITSSTIMAPCAWAPEAIAFAKAHPELAIGLHLTTTCEWGRYRWEPVNKEHYSTLIDEEGFMWHESDQFEKNASEEDADAEIRAQLAKVRRLGFEPSHLDNHMGSLYGIETGRFELLGLVFRLAGENGLPFRFPTKFTDEQFTNKMLDIKVPKEMVYMLLDQIKAMAEESHVPVLDYLMPGDWAGPQNDSYEDFREYLFELYRNIPEGITETYIHPASESEELKNITGAWHRRVWEYRLFKDPATKQHIESLGIRLINYRDLKRMRGY
ncbi:MAG: polysaccharide deacetylase family protein [Clostridia bacterium]|nr:polysaccharide deacetylase family protein [Clostridia bacterium]